jgi:hypothetical protein
MAEREVLEAIFENSAFMKADHLKPQLAHRHMIALADTYDGWAQDERMTPEKSARMLGWAEGMRLLAEEVGPAWDPPTPPTVTLIGFLGRLVLHEPTPPPTPQLHDPRVPLRQDSVLASQVELFRGWTLSVTCPMCVERRQLAVEQLDGRTKQPQSIASAIAKLRCRTCGAAPSWVQIQDTPLPTAKRIVRLI